MITNYTIRLFRIFCYYLVLFAFCRLIFLFYFSGTLIHEQPAIYLMSLYNALPLDISTACYLLFIPALIILPGYFFKDFFFKRLIKVYLIFTSSCFIIIALSEIGVYQELQVKIYYNLFTHVSHPGEIFRVVSFTVLFSFLFALAIVLFLCIKAINAIVNTGSQVKRNFNPGQGAILFAGFVVITALLLIGCRGGLQPVAINEGEVYFSSNQCVNDATVNALWSLTHSFIENRRVLRGNVYKTTSDEEAGKIVHDLFSVEKDSTIHILKYKRPNICIVILESWSADLVASLGGFENLTPNFEKLIKQGYLFTNIKPSGCASDQGIPAILSGYPALPVGSAINQPERQVHLSSINNELLKENYYPSFFYGGQLIYGGIKSYLYRSRFTRVIEQKDLSSSLPPGRMGIHDSLMLSIWLDSLNQMPRPFFSCLFTVSTHSPFDAPYKRTIDWGGIENHYLNCVVYSDQQLGKFFEEVKKQSWYDSTLFILVADHSHTTPKDHPFGGSEFYHIPLLLWGGALKDEYKGIKNDGLGAQTDIVATLLHQLDIQSDEYRWSNDLLNPYTRHFAFYTFAEGFGFCDTGGIAIWNKLWPSWDKTSGSNPQLREAEGHAMLQVLMNDYLAR